MDQLKHLRKEHQKGNIAISKANMDQTMHCNVTLVFFLQIWDILGQLRNPRLNYSKLEYPGYLKPIQSVRPDMCDHQQGLHLFN